MDLLLNYEESTLSKTGRLLGEFMSAHRYITTVVFAALALQITLQAQECGSRGGWGSFHLQWPYTAEYREKHEYSDYEGRPIPTQEYVEVVAQDSQGRFLHRSTSANGSSNSYVRDPVAAQKIVWNTGSTKAKILKYPTPVAGRPSCWQGPDSERHPSRDEPTVGWTKLSCGLAGRYEPECRDICAAERRAKALPPERSGFPKCDPAEPGGTAEDLGMDVIQGVEAHGCRTTTPFAKGKRKLRETWSDEYGLIVRRIEEDPTDAKYYEEIISLNRDEPPLSTFQPPKEYEVVTLEMDEVPCEQPTQSPH